MRGITLLFKTVALFSSLKQVLYPKEKKKGIEVESGIVNVT